jgi:hypothetical protein
MHDLHNREPEAQKAAESFFQRKIAVICGSELENAAFSYHIIRKCVEAENVTSEIDLAMAYILGGTHTECLENFKMLFLEPFYEYLDEELDDQKAILGFLRRYKHKCEWFNRQRLFGLWSSNTREGEKLLALHLYEYLHDQGFDFTIEPHSISGEVDLVVAQQSNSPLIADAKIFNPERGKGKQNIINGFNQIYLYTLDFNEPFGYLIIYKTSGADLRLLVEKQSQSIPFVVHNSKAIALLIIDIFPHTTTASQRGRIKTLEITERDLIKVIKKPKKN